MPFAQVRDLLSRPDKDSYRQLIALLAQVRREEHPEAVPTLAYAHAHMATWSEEPPEALKDLEVHVDLKHSAWSVDRETWDDYGFGDDFDMLEAAYTGAGVPLLVRSSPRRAGTNGTVYVSKGTASGLFTLVWDEPEDLASSLGLDLEELDDTTLPGVVENFPDMLPYSAEADGYGVGLRWSLPEGYAHTWEQVCAYIDEREEEAIRLSDAAWAELVEWAEYVTAQHNEEEETTDEDS